MSDDIPESERAISEKFRIVAKAHNVAFLRWQELDELKTPELERRILAVMTSAAPESKMTASKAETLVKASDEWHEYCLNIARAKAKAALLADHKTFLRMQLDEQKDANANRRAEMNMTGH